MLKTKYEIFKMALKKAGYNYVNNLPGNIVFSVIISLLLIVVFRTPNQQSLVGYFFGLMIGVYIGDAMFQYQIMRSHKKKINDDPPQS